MSKGTQMTKFELSYQIMLLHKLKIVAIVTKLHKLHFVMSDKLAKYELHISYNILFIYIFIQLKCCHFTPQTWLLNEI